MSENDSSKIAVLEERVANWMSGTTFYRKDLCAKLDLITEEVIKINSRCVNHIAEAKEFSNHIEEHKTKRTIWDDRNFKIVMALAGGAWALMFWLVQHQLGGINNEYKQLNKSIQIK